MISTKDVRPGMALELEDGLVTIVGYQRGKPGQGRAFVPMKLEKLDTGQVVNRAFRADGDVTQARIVRSDFPYLSSADLGFHFMNLDDYSKVVPSPDDVGDAADYLLD